MKIKQNATAPSGQQTGSTKTATKSLSDGSTFEVIKIQRDNLYRNPFRYLSEPPKMRGEKRTGEADE